MARQNQSVKQITKAKKEPKKESKAKKTKGSVVEAKRGLAEIDFTATLSSCILQMFCQLETTAMNNTRLQLADFRLLIATASREQMESKKTMYLENLPEAISQGWSLFKAGQSEMAKIVFVDTLAAPPTPQDKVSEDLPMSKLVVETPPPTPPLQIQDDQYDSGIEVDTIDSPSLYMLPNQDYLRETVTIKEEAIPSTSHSPSN